MKIKHRHKKVARRVGSDGFARPMTRHAALFFPRGDTLIVGFDNMKSRDQSAPAYPWGFKAVKKAGHSHLAIVMSRRNDWYRHPDLAAFFDELRDTQFFARFERVVFYGASMGGYGALAYSASCPGAEVVTYSPQTSLDPAVAPFETRYRNGYGRGDWAGAYVDAAEMAQYASKVTVFADPYHDIDALHVARLPGHNLVFHKCPYFGHVVARHFKHMDILADVTRHAWDGTLDAQRFSQLRRGARHRAQSVTRAILMRGVETGHPRLVERALAGLGHSHPDWKFPRVRKLAMAA